MNNYLTYYLIIQVLFNLLLNYWTIIGQSFLEGIDGNFENWKDNSQEKSEKYKKGKGIRNGAQGKEERDGF